MVNIILTALAIIGLGIVLMLATVLIGVIGIGGFYLIKYGLIILIVALTIKCIKKLLNKAD